MKKILTFSVNAILLGMVILGALIILSLLPIPGKYRIYVVQSGSMEPTIRTGSLIFVKPQSGYATGDIVTWRPISGRTTVTHRIVETKERDGRTVFFTKGDANEARDEAMQEQQIVGKTLFSLPYLGYPVNLAKTRAGFLLLVILPAFLIVLDEVNNIRKELERRSLRRKEERRQAEAFPEDIPFRVTYPKNMRSMDGIVRWRPLKTV